MATNNTKLEFYFDTDFTLNEMVEEINRYQRDTFLGFNKNIDLEGDWTRVPQVKHKLKLVHCPGLWDK